MRRAAQRDHRVSIGLWLARSIKVHTEICRLTPCVASPLDRTAGKRRARRRAEKWEPDDFTQKQQKAGPGAKGYESNESESDDSDEGDGLYWTCAAGLRKTFFSCADQELAAC